MLVGWWRTTPFDSFLLLFTFIRLTSSRTDRTTGESWEPEMGTNSMLKPHTNSYSQEHITRNRFDLYRSYRGLNLNHMFQA